MGQGGREVALLLNSIGQLNLAQRNSRQSPLPVTHFFPLLLICSPLFPELPSELHKELINFLHGKAKTLGPSFPWNCGLLCIS